VYVYTWTTKSRCARLTARTTAFFVACTALSGLSLADEPAQNKAKAGSVAHAARQDQSTQADAPALSKRAPTYHVRLRQNARTPATPEIAWHYDFLERMLAVTEPQTARRQPRILTATSMAGTRSKARTENTGGLPTTVSAQQKANTSTPLTQLAPVEVRATADTAKVVTLNAAKPTTNPIATSAIVVPQPPALPRTLQGDDLVMTAERAQAAQDLVKLELSLRTYEELRQSGQPAFETRPDWRILERAQDALSGAELSAAQAVGFEANAYINETQKTIVIGIAGTKDLRRHLIAADIWQALIKAEQPQHFFMAKSYARSVITRYQRQGFQTECVGHSLGGGACAYLAAELGIRALVVNPITAGKPAPGARFLVTNYVVDGDIANLVYGARGNEFGGETQWVSDGRGAARAKIMERYGPLAGPILVVKDLRSSLDAHKLTRALDLIAQHAAIERIK
jgi:hypothetical protein